jgi:hypothetical protein
MKLTLTEAAEYLSWALGRTITRRNLGPVSGTQVHVSSVYKHRRRHPECCEEYVGTVCVFDLIGGSRFGHLLVLLFPRDEAEEAVLRARVDTLPIRSDRTSEAAIAVVRELIAETGLSVSATQRRRLEKAAHAYHCHGALKALHPVRDPQTGRFMLDMADLEAFVALSRAERRAA